MAVVAANHGAARVHLPARFGADLPRAALPTEAPPGASPDMSLLSNLWTLLGVAGAALGAVVLAYFRGRRAGKSEERAKATESAIERINEDKKRDNEIAGLSPAERERRGQRWVRPEAGP
jgi:hypothetical protein